MKAMVTTAARTMRLTEVPLPGAAGDAEALVRIESVGLCGSDYGLYTGDYYHSCYPIVQGHEFSAIVEELPDAYQGDVCIGDRVAVEPLLPCGVCYACRKGSYNCCSELRILGVHVPGALEEKLLVPAACLFAVGDLAADLTTFVEPVSIALQGLNRVGFDDGEQVLVLGAGPIGQAVLLAVRDRGGRAMVTDVLPNRVAAARHNGAEVAIAGDDLTMVAETAAAWTDDEGPGLVVDATGIAEVVRTAVAAVASSGRVLLLGRSQRDVPLPLSTLINKELSLIASRNSARVFGEAVNVVRRRREEVERLITHTYRLEDVAGAIDFAIAHPDEVIKAVVHVMVGEEPTN